MGIALMFAQCGNAEIYSEFEGSWVPNSKYLWNFSAALARH